MYIWTIQYSQTDQSENQATLDVSPDLLNLCLSIFTFEYIRSILNPNILCENPKQNWYFDIKMGDKIWPNMNFKWTLPCMVWMFSYSSGAEKYCSKYFISKYSLSAINMKG